MIAFTKVCYCFYWTHGNAMFLKDMWIVSVIK